MSNNLSPSSSPLFHSTYDTSSSWTAKVWEADLTPFWMKGIKIVLSLLIITILTGMAGGVFRIFFHLEAIFHDPLEQVFRQLIVDTLIILASSRFLKPPSPIFQREG